jgi:nitrate reductase NapE component
LFIVLSFVVYPILGRLRQAFARAMPRTASVDSQRFSSEWLEI